jgi:hypothetical protein
MFPLEGARTMVSPAPSPNTRTITLFARPALALRLARLFPCLRIVVFHHHWPAIDDARQAAIAMGLADRIHIHHTSAAPGTLRARPCNA